MSNKNDIASRARVTIERLGAGSDAIAHLESGKTVFVPFGCPGDVVDIEIISDKDRFAVGRIVEMIEPSPDRTVPECPYFAECGGCDWQHIAYPQQLEVKRTMVIDALARIGKIQGAADLVAECLPSKKAYGYRNKIELEARMQHGKLVIGFHRRGSDELFPIDYCPLMSKRAMKAPKAIGGALRYLTGSQDLGIERIGIRSARYTDDVEVALYTSPGAFPRGVVSKMIKQALPNVKSIVRVLLKDKAGTRKVSSVEVLAGKGFWRETINDIEYMVSAPSFFQVNTCGAEDLVRLVVDFLDPDGSDTALDLYSGVGTFTIPLANAANETIAIESYGPAVRDLRRNLEANQTWAEAVGGDAAREIGDAGFVDVAVVDPPRAGLAPEVIDALIAGKPRKLAYVSCDPATLARDLAKLVAGGFVLTEVRPVDLFPQTHHVECVALMTGPK